MKVFALVALVASTSAVKLSYEGITYPWGNPYSISEQDSTNKELQDAWMLIESRKLATAQQETESKEVAEAKAKYIEEELDMTHPSHIQGRKYEIEY